jgi:hypothetical protein
MNKSVTIALILLFLLNFSAGLIYLNEGLFHFDSVWLARAVENTYKTSMLHPQVKGRYGSVLINLIVYLPFYLMGQNADLSVRVSSVLFHALSVVAFFLFIRELFKNTIQAFFAGLLLSFTPFYFQPNTYGKEHGASLFFALLAFYFLVKGLNRNSLILSNLASALFIFSVSIREGMLILLPFFLLVYFEPLITMKPLNVTFPKERCKPKFIIPFFLFFCVVFSFPFFFYLKDVIFDTLTFRGSLGNNFFVGFTRLVFENAFPDLFISMPFLLFLLYFFGIFLMLRDKKYFKVAFFILWSLTIFYLGNLIGYSARTLEVIMVAIYGLASYALCYLYGKRKIVAYSLVIYIVLSMFLFMLPMLEFRHSYNGAKRAALLISRDTPDNSLIIAHDFWVFLDYYGNRKTLKFPESTSDPESTRERVDEFVNKVKGILNNKVPVYIVADALNNFCFLILRTSLLGNFDFTFVKQYLNEDYHRPELQINLFKERLFRVRLRPKDIKESSLN